MKLPPDPYSSIPTKLRVKLQSYVPSDAKDRLMLVCPDRNLYTLLINHALRRAVEFIDTFGLAYNPADQQRLLDFVVNGRDLLSATPEDGLRKHAVACAAGDTIPRDGTRGTAGVPTAHPHLANVTPVLREGTPRGRKGKGGKGGVK